MGSSAWVAVVLAAIGCSGVAGEEPPPSPAQRFVPVAAGVVRDARSELLWTARDSGAELPWSAAAERCRGLDRASGSGTGAIVWRLPTSEELTSLYDESQDQACGPDRCHLDPAVELTSPYQWSSTARGRDGDRRVYVDFRHGSELAPLLRPALTRRALCVGDRASRRR